MRVKKKKARLVSPLPKEFTKYRLVNGSSSYVPSIYTSTTSFANRINLIITTEQTGEKETSGN